MSTRSLFHSITLSAVCLWLLGCTAASAPQLQPTLAPAAAAAASPTAQAVVADLPTAVVATQPPPATPAPQPTSTRPPATGTPAQTATPAFTPTATSEFDCRPRSELAAVRPTFQLVPGPWSRPNPIATELIATNSGQPPLVHLGFDVEGDPAPLAELLDILDARQVKATMFILGSWADSYPGWIEEFHRRGHELANHTYSHSNMRQMTEEDIVAELTRTEEIVQRLTGQTTKPWLRPPFGSRSEESIAAAYEAGWTTVIWTGSTEDWLGDTTADEMCRKLREGTYPGGILYSHTYHPEVPEAIDRFIGEAQAQGYTVVPLSVLWKGGGSDLLPAQNE